MKKNMKKISFLKSPAAKIAAAVLAVLAAFVIFFLCAVLPHGKIAKGVTVGGVDLSHMSVSQAQAALMGSAHPADGQEITLYTEVGAEKRISGAEIGLSYDAALTAEEAYKIGRSGGFFENAGTLLSLWFSPMEMQYKCNADSERLSEILYAFGVELNGELENYTLEYAEDSVRVSPGRAGQSRDTSAEAEAVMHALGEGETRIAVKLEPTEPAEPTADALYSEIYIEPQNARYEITGGRVNFVPEVNGRQIDKIEAGTKLAELKNGGAITLKLVTLYPEVTMDTLNRQLFNHVLGSYSTTYSTSAKNRSKNVELAAARLNGVILAPGEVFSYNDVVGARTRANGFLEAPVYENGETVQGMGGGVCQVSSTLYSAVLYADLKTVERQNHSMTVAYIPKGQDATVAYGAIDYKFKNDTAYPIKLAASAGGGKVEISIYGTKPEKEKMVKITNTVLETKEPTVTETPDPSLATGSKKVVSKGKTGYTVKTVRTVYENGEQVKSEEMKKSVYKMIPTKVAIGTKVPAPLPTLAPLPTATPVPTAAPSPDENAAEPAE